MNGLTLPKTYNYMVINYTSEQRSKEDENIWHRIDRNKNSSKSTRRSRGVKNNNKKKSWPAESCFQSLATQRVAPDIVVAGDDVVEAERVLGERIERLVLGMLVQRRRQDQISAVRRWQPQRGVAADLVHAEVELPERLRAPRHGCCTVLLRADRLADEPVLPRAVRRRRRRLRGGRPSCDRSMTRSRCRPIPARRRHRPAPP